MKTGISARLQLTNSLPFKVHNLNGNLLSLLLQQVINLGAHGWILAHEAAVSAPVRGLHLPTDRGDWFKEMNLRLEHVGGQLPERRHVKNPQAPAMSRGHHFAGCRMQREIMNRNRR
jgi:hypothetical protein